MEPSRLPNQPHARSYPRIDTSSRSTEGRSNRNNIYSWVETPMELHSDRRNVKSRTQEIPPLPTIPAAAQNNQVTIETQPETVANDYPQDKKLNDQESYSHSTANEVDLATFAPATENVNPSQEQSAYGDNATHNLPAPPSSIPVKESIPTPMSTASDLVGKPRADKLLPNRTFVPSYHPDAFSGPNSPPSEYHLPGQASHPSQQIKGGPWKHGLFDCSSDMGTCCTGIFCPCILYGKTQYRLQQRSNKEDPTNLLGYEAVNGSCLTMSVLCGFHWVLAGIQHARVRRTYRLPGGIGSDCGKAICCCWCTLIQDENEVKDREERARQLTGASKSMPYMAPESMSYAPPPR